MGKHAYLIMAHNQFDVLEKLLCTLDDARNDIYLHIDIKSGNVDAERFRKQLSKSELYMTERMSITWAGESQVLCEMMLFREAAKKGYDYYHLISGADFPIKTQEEIHSFFDTHQGAEFVDFWINYPHEYHHRIRYYYHYQERIGRYTNDLPTLILRVRSKLDLMAQRMRGIDRLKDVTMEIKLGSNWVSLTHDAICYLLEHETQIQEMFCKGITADELFVQTMLWNSPFQESVYQGPSTRLIDWNRGDPYTWTDADLAEIHASDAMFVRKVTSENSLVDILQKELIGDAHAETTN